MRRPRYPLSMVLIAVKPAFFYGCYPPPEFGFFISTLGSGGEGLAEASADAVVTVSLGSDTLSPIEMKNLCINQKLYLIKF